MCFQLNQATNKLDMSQLYGTSNSATIDLRTLKNGELKTACSLANPCLPVSDDPNLYCAHNTTDNTICYKSGNLNTKIVNIRIKYK